MKDFLSTFSDDITTVLMKSYLTSLKLKINKDKYLNQPYFSKFLLEKNIDIKKIFKTKHKTRDILVPLLYEFTGCESMLFIVDDAVLLLLQSPISKITSPFFLKTLIDHPMFIVVIDRVILQMIFYTCKIYDASCKIYDASFNKSTATFNDYETFKLSNKEKMKFNFIYIDGKYCGRTIQNSAGDLGLCEFYFTSGK